MAAIRRANNIRRSVGTDRRAARRDARRVAGEIIVLVPDAVAVQVALMRLLLLSPPSRGEEPVTLAYRSTDTLSRTTGTRISRTGRYAWLDHEKWAAYAGTLRPEQRDH